MDRPISPREIDAELRKASGAVFCKPGNVKMCGLGNSGRRSPHILKSSLKNIVQEQQGTAQLKQNTCLCMFVRVWERTAIVVVSCTCSLAKSRVDVFGKPQED